MKCLIGDGVSVDILRDDLTCVDIIEQKLSSGGREVGSCSISTFYIQFCQQYFGYMCWFSGNFNISFIRLQDSDDAFYIVDLADILLKHKKWVSLLPRVEPFYGKFSKIPLKVFVILSRDSAWITGQFYMYIGSQKNLINLKNWILLIFCGTILNSYNITLYLVSLPTDRHVKWISFFFFPAMKCNNDPVILKMLTGLGIGFDCASKVQDLNINY